MNNSYIPLVSVGLPSCNGARFIRRALDSILSQTFADFELIISDDSSTDETPQICEEYTKRDTRIQLVRNHFQTGYIGNFCSIVPRARGKYFVWIADDDWWAPRYLETLVGALEARKEYGAAQSSHSYRYSDGSEARVMVMEGKYDITKNGHFGVYRKVFTRSFRLNHFIYGVFRKELLDRFVANPSGESASWDKIFASEFALAARFLTVPAVLRFVHILSPEERRARGEYYSEEYTKKSKYRSRSLSSLLLSAHARVMLASLHRALHSQLVPFKRKVGILVLFPFILFTTQKRTFVVTWKDLAGALVRKLKKIFGYIDIPL